MESIFSGLLVSMIIENKFQHNVNQPSPLLLFSARQAESQNICCYPETTISGQLWRHLITENKNFQPMNANFGLLPPLKEKIKDKKLKKQKLAERSIYDLKKAFCSQ